jgi:hypothetical protein
MIGAAAAWACSKYSTTDQASRLALSTNRGDRGHGRAPPGDGGAKSCAGEFSVANQPNAIF